MEMYNDLHTDSIDCISLACEEPVRFRSLLLIAASYYAWNSGGLNDFKSTYHYHMSRCIRQVNDWLALPGEVLSTKKPCVMELIACLSITESLVGNFAASKVHLDGLITILEMQRSRQNNNLHHTQKANQNQADLEEIAERHTMISFDFTTGLQTHRREVDQGQFSIKGHRVHQKADGWKKDFMGHDKRLNAMLRTLRFFSMPEIEAHTRRFDARSSIEALRRTTELVNQGLSPLDPSICTDEPVWTFGSSALMMVSEDRHFLKHDESKSGIERPLITSRSCLDVACGFYMYGILGIGNGDGAVQGRFTRQIFEILKRDVNESKQDVLSGHADRNFWLWKVVVGAYGLALMELQSQLVATSRLFDTIAGGQATVLKFKTWFHDQFKIWSKITGVKQYSGVRDALLTIVWPAKPFSREVIVVETWSRAMSR